MHTKSNTHIFDLVECGDLSVIHIPQFVEPSHDPSRRAVRPSGDHSPSMGVDESHVPARKSRPN